MFAVAWVNSRTYTLEESRDGTVVVAKGIPWSALGVDPSSDWQATGVPADAVRTGDPDALASTFRGQGEAVALAARQFVVEMRAKKPIIIVDAYFDGEGRACCARCTMVSNPSSTCGVSSPQRTAAGSIIRRTR